MILYFASNVASTTRFFHLKRISSHLIGEADCNMEEQYNKSFGGAAAACTAIGIFL